MEGIRLESGRLRLEGLKACLLWLESRLLGRLEPRWLASKPRLLRRLTPRKARWLRLLKARRSLARKAGGLRGDATWLESWLESLLKLRLLLLWIKASLQRDLESLTPLRHPALRMGSRVKEKVRVVRKSGDSSSLRVTP